MQSYLFFFPSFSSIYSPPSMKFFIPPSFYHTGSQQFLPLSSPATVPTSQLGQRAWGEAQMLVWPDRSRPVAALSLPFAAPTLMGAGKSIMGAGKTGIILVLGSHMEQKEKSLWPPFSIERTQVHCPAWQSRMKKGLTSGNKKPARCHWEKALQISLPHQLLLGFLVLGKDKGTEWATAFLKVLWFSLKKS